MATDLIPAIGASGQWKLKAPYDTKLLPNLSYKCEAIRKLSEVVASGLDAYEEYYVINSIDKSVYDEHVAAGISIVALISSSGIPLYVPSPYLDGWPSSDVIPYVVLGAVLTLGALPNTIDPSFLAPTLKNAVKNALGHEPDVQFIALSEVSNKLFPDHEALEALRLSNITDDNSDYARRLKAEADLVVARNEIQALQQFIIDSGVPVPTVPGP